MKKEFINKPIIEEKDFVEKETHPHEIPLHVGTEAVNTITSHYSFVIDTIKNKNHKLEKMMEEGILDVIFIRVESVGNYKWYFEDHKTPRLTDRLTNELEEKTSVYRRPFAQGVGRGFRASQMSESSKQYFNLTEAPYMRSFLDPALGVSFQEPKIRKESEQPKTPVRDTKIPEFPEDRVFKSNTPNVIKFIRNLFAYKKK